MSLAPILGLIAGFVGFGVVVYLVLRPMRRERGRDIHYVDIAPVPRQSSPIKG